MAMLVLLLLASATPSFSIRRTIFRAPLSPPLSTRPFCSRLDRLQCTRSRGVDQFSKHQSPSFLLKSMLGLRGGDISDDTTILNNCSSIIRKDIFDDTSVMNFWKHPFFWFTGAVAISILYALLDGAANKTSVWCFLFFLLIMCEVANLLRISHKTSIQQVTTTTSGIDINNANVTSFVENNNSRLIILPPLRGGDGSNSGTISLTSIGMTLLNTAIRNPVLVGLIIGVTVANIYEDKVAFASLIKNTFMYTLVGYIFYLLVQWQKMQQEAMELE